MTLLFLIQQAIGSVDSLDHRNTNKFDQIARVNQKKYLTVIKCHVETCQTVCFSQFSSQ